jgi:16S rRNA processing protein RimM
MTEYIKIGKFVSAFGVNGELVLKHNFGKKTALKGLQAVFIEERKERFIPWFIQSIRIKSADEVYVHVADVATREAALKLVQKEVWATDADFKKFAAASSPINLLGYMVVEEDKTLGTILEVVEQPHQLLCRIEMQGKEVLIPLHEGTLLKIDKKAKQVKVQLPEGLLEIYI